MTNQAASGARPRRGLHRVVVEELGQRIIRGELPPGVALPTEADLSTELAVSRTVVREAIKVLAAKGLVESRPKTGTRALDRRHWNMIDPDVLGWVFAAGPDPRLFRDLSEVRDFIEPRAAELAASRATDEERARIVALCTAMQAAADAPSYIAADLALHEAILEATHNELLVQMTHAIVLALRAGRTITVQAAGGPASAHGFHRGVVQAIDERDPVAARVAMEDLIVGAAADVEAVLARPREGATTAAPRPG